MDIPSEDKLVPRIPSNEMDPLIIEGNRRWDEHVALIGSAGIVSEIKYYLERAEENWCYTLPTKSFNDQA